jgi:phosphopantetheinyl transferase (holo-ACP synthase)
LVEIREINKTIRLGLLHLPDYAVFTGISGKRELEKNGAVYLLEKMFNKACELNYSEEGKPSIKNSDCHISISHSHDKLVILSNNASYTGVDIELIRDKVIKIKDKFLSEPELTTVQDNVEKLIIYWAAKEALYKLYGKKEVEFARHLYVHPFDLSSSGEITGEIRLETFQKKFRLHYEKLGEYMLVYILEELG